MAPRGGWEGVSRWVGGWGGRLMKLRVIDGVVRDARVVVVVTDLRARCALRRGSRFIVMMDVCVCVETRVELDWIVCCCLKMKIESMTMFLPRNLGFGPRR